MDFVQKKHNDWLIVELPADMNYEGNLTLKNEIERLCKEGEKKLCLDLSNTNYIGSLTLGVFSFAQKHLDAIEGKFCVKGPKQNIMEILELMGIVKIIKIIEDDSQLE